MVAENRGGKVLDVAENTPPDRPEGDIIVVTRSGQITPQLANT